MDRRRLDQLAGHCGAHGIGSGSLEWVRWALGLLPSAASCPPLRSGQRLIELAACQPSGPPSAVADMVPQRHRRTSADGNEQSLWNCYRSLAAEAEPSCLLLPFRPRETILCREAKFVIGRSEDAQPCLDDPLASAPRGLHADRRHCLTIEDLGHAQRRLES